MWFPRTNIVGGISLVSASNQAIYNGAEIAPFLGIGNDLLQKYFEENY